MTGHQRPNRAQVAVLRANRRIDLEQAKRQTAEKKQAWQQVVAEIERVERIAEEKVGWRKKKE